MLENVFSEAEPKIALVSEFQWNARKLDILLAPDVLVTVQAGLIVEGQGFHLLILQPIVDFLIRSAVNVVKLSFVVVATPVDLY